MHKMFPQLLQTKMTGQTGDGVYKFTVSQLPILIIQTSESNYEIRPNRHFKDMK